MNIIVKIKAVPGEGAPGPNTPLAVDDDGHGTCYVRGAMPGEATIGRTPTEAEMAGLPKPPVGEVYMVENTRTAIRPAPEAA